MRCVNYLKILLMMALLISISQAVVETDIIIKDRDDENSSASAKAPWGEIGFRFITRDIPRYALKFGLLDLNNSKPVGGPEGDGLIAAHPVTLWEISYDIYGEPSGTVVAQVTVPAGTAGELIDSYRYATLPTPYLLKPNTEYALSGSSAGLYDYWLWPAAVTLNSYFVDSSDPNNWTRAVTPTVGGFPDAQWTSIGSQHGFVNMAGSSLIAAHQPTPSNGAVNAGQANGSNRDVLLEWKTGVDLRDSDIPDPNITRHTLYLDTNEAKLGHGLGSMIEVNIPAGSPVDANAQYLASSLDNNTVYYWRVDESVNNSVPGDYEHRIGEMWSFTTVGEVPVITDQPDDVLAVESDTVVFDIGVTSAYTEQYTWYKSADGQVGGDTQVGTGSTLTITDVNINDDEAFYYCKVTSTGGTAYSDVVGLWFEREIGRWRMNDNLNDSSGLGFNGVWDDFGTPNVPAQTFDTNAVEGTHSVSLHADPNAFVSIPGSNDFFNHHVVGITASVWTKGPQRAGWKVFASKEDVSVGFAEEEGRRGWFLGRNSLGIAAMAMRGVGTVFADDAGRIDDDNWHMVTGVYEPEEGGTGGTVSIYVDGSLESSEYFATAEPLKSVADVAFGIEDTNDLTYAYMYRGLLDDIRIFTYPKTSTEVADLYLEHITDASICIDGENLEFDFNGDCKTDFQDYAYVAQEWLECNLPISQCD